MKRLRWLLSAISAEEWTQTRIAFSLGKSLQTISLWEAGNLPTPRNQQRVIDFYSEKLSLPLTREILHNESLNTLVELGLSENIRASRESKTLIQIKQFLSNEAFKEKDLTLLLELIRRLTSTRKKAR